MKNKGTRFLAPGPVNVPFYVWEAMKQPVIHHRSEEFEILMKEVGAGLQYLFQTTNPVLLLSGSGTFGMESAIFSCFRPGEEILIADNGKFSHRWVSFAGSLGIKADAITAEWGSPVSVDEVMAALEQKNYKGLILTHCETSTGVQTDLEEISFKVKSVYPDLIVAADAISSAAICPLYTDAWGLDIVTTASQKGLLNPAGMSFVALSPPAAERCAHKSGDHYMDLGNYLRALEQNSTPFTPATHIIYGIAAALRRIKEISLPAIWNEVHASSQYFKRALAENEIATFGAANSDVLTAIHLTQNNATAVIRRLKGEFGLEPAGGQGHLKDSILRIAHFGDGNMKTMKELVPALKEVLKR